MDDIIHKLIEKRLTIYQAVGQVLKLKKDPTSALSQMLIQSESPFFRLFSAWCLGKIRNPKVKKLLETAYKSEKNDNVRANIVWAYLAIAKPKTDFCNNLLNDDYFLIKLIVLKRIHPRFSFISDCSIARFLVSSEHPLVRIEAIRKAHYFKSDRANIYRKIKKIIYYSKSSFEIGACLRAIGKSEDCNAIDILIKYYAANKSYIMKHTNIIISLCRAISDCNESKAYAILYEIYFSFGTSELVRYTALEALSIGGGPNSYEVLSKIYTRESDLSLKKFIGTLMASTKITHL